MLEYNQDMHGRIVALHSPITCLVDVEEATKPAEIARKLKMYKKSILSINVYGSKARRGLCYYKRMGISSNYLDASIYIGLC